MQAIPRRLTFSLLLALLSCAPALAQEERMQLLAPNVGWVLGGGKLYWTTDNGGHWTDITPPVPERSVKLTDVFFRDAAEGWALLSGYDHASDTWRFDLAETNDSGVTWSVTPVVYPDLPQWLRDAIGGLAAPRFVDRLHGWMVMGLAGNSRPGRLLATEDGGRNWNWVNGPGIAGAIRFITTQDGWMAGGMDAKLYATHDGGKSWQEVALKPPPQVAAGIYPAYGLPVFGANKRGFLPVSYMGGENIPSKLVVYATDDLGRTWRPAGVLAESNLISADQIVPLAIADSVLIVSTSSSPTSVSVATVPLTGEATADAIASPMGALALSFADTTHGWVLSAFGKLLSTTDGGATWADVTPWRGTAPGRTPRVPSAPGAAGAANGTALLGINGQGQIVGEYVDSSNNQHSFLWNHASDSSLVPIDKSGARQTVAHGINASGQVVGLYEDAKGTHTFLYYNGSFSSFPNDPNACTNCTYGFGINNLNRVVGRYDTSPGVTHGFWAVPPH